MKWEVKFYVGGKVFTEEVYASSHRDARETATARNPRVQSNRSEPDCGQLMNCPLPLDFGTCWADPYINDMLRDFTTCNSLQKMETWLLTSTPSNLQRVRFTIV